MPYGTYSAMIETVDEHGLKHWRLVKTKKELKETVKEAPERITITDLSLMGSGTPRGQVMFNATEIVAGTFFGTIVGPDPHNKRDWYAKIERTETGKLKVT